MDMKRTTLRASLVGSAAAGLLATALATPAFAQATTYPAGTDCSTISNAANRTDCMSQQNESRQNEIPGQQQQFGNPAPGAPATGTGGAAGAAPATPAAPGGAAGTSGTGGTGTGGAAGSGTTTP